VTECEGKCERRSGSRIFLEDEDIGCGPLFAMFGPQDETCVSC
jgi:hypothetical protein